MARFEEAVQLYHRKDFAGAEAAFQKLTDKDPDQSVYWLNLGNAQYQMDKKTAAKSNWQQALALNPIEANAYLNLGNYYYAEEDYPLAITYWEKFQTLEPDNPTVILNLGLAYEKSGKLWQGFEYYNYYVELSPGSKDAVKLKDRIEKGNEAYLNNIGYAEKMLKEGNLEKALIAFDQTLAAYPGTPRTYKSYGAALMKQQRFADALNAYEAANIQYNEDGTVLINLGVLYEKLNQPFEAIWAYQQAIGLKVKEASKLTERVNKLVKSNGSIFQQTFEDCKTLLTKEHLNAAERQFNRLSQLGKFCPELQDKVTGGLKVIARQRDPMIYAKQFFYETGEKAREEGNYPGAMSAYAKYLEIAPDGEHAAEITQKKASMHEQMGKVIGAMLKD